MPLWLAQCALAAPPKFTNSLTLCHTLCKPDKEKSCLRLKKLCKHYTPLKPYNSATNYLSTGKENDFVFKK